MTLGGVWWGVLVNFGEFDKIVAIALRSNSKAGSKGRSLCNLRRYFVYQDRVLLEA